jgi:hypothetical protein
MTARYNLINLTNDGDDEEDGDDNENGSDFSY